MRDTEGRSGRDTVDDAVATLQDLFAGFGRPRARAMFGGHGVWVEDRMVALVADGRAYLKTDAESRPAFEEAGAQPFSYERKDGSRTTTSYWSVPPGATGSAGDFEPWARRAVAAAERTAARRG